ncbi:MAG: hypothetical protein KDD77_17420, partial [Caldilineaceae bacterium]|nr:hypothetical protein [Caldilineaceae bacterium]
NSQPMGFYSPSQLVQDARRHNIEVRPVDVLHSDWESTLEASMGNGSQPAIRLGLQRVKGMKEDTALRIVIAREKHGIASLEDLAARARLDRGDLARLTEAGAFKSLSGNRYRTHWTASGILPDMPLAPDKCAEEDSTYLPAPSETDDLRADYQSLGLTLGRHPMAILRETEPFNKFRTAADISGLNHGRFVQVAGIVTGRQRPSSASGVLFLTLEDEYNNINVIIWTRILERYRRAIIGGRLLKVKGVVEREGRVIHVVAGHVEDMSHYLEHFALASRDFR